MWQKGRFELVHSVAEKLVREGKVGFGTLLGGRFGLEMYWGRRFGLVNWRAGSPRQAGW